MNTPNSQEETFSIAGFEMPSRLAALTGCPPEAFEEYGNAQFRCMQQYLNIRGDESVLEVGCGIGRLALPLTEVLQPEGNYLGIDIIKDSIDWCTAHITRRYPHFRFHFENVTSPIHNPAGTEHPASTRLPLPSSSVDKIFLSSVFTHMFPDGVNNYLREFKRVLRPGGLVLSTMFLLNEVSREFIRAGKANWTFSHAYNHSEICFFDDPQYPEGAIAYDEAGYLDLIRRHGMDLRQPIVYGTWSATHRISDGQDYVIFGPNLPSSR